jgi:5-methylcytosine-specific restriction enzyme subunit McrC
MPAEIVHDEYTPDIAENRLLRTACERLCRLPVGIPDQVRGDLLRLRVRLADIAAVGRGHVLPSWRPTRLNARYHQALGIASRGSQRAWPREYPSIFRTPSPVSTITMFSS